mmetsp:Transcript_80153/g.144718  ORF Transcript_80153/g.144718 Transcript_80153/m.144718 type:complete len:557 (-) Transcript_80153:941-2611(-)
MLSVRGVVVALEGSALRVDFRTQTLRLVLVRSTDILVLSPQRLSLRIQEVFRSLGFGPACLQLLLKSLLLGSCRAAGGLAALLAGQAFRRGPGACCAGGLELLAQGCLLLSAHLVLSLELQLPIFALLDLIQHRLELRPGSLELYRLALKLHLLGLMRGVGALVPILGFSDVRVRDVQICPDTSLQLRCLLSPGHGLVLRRGGLLHGGGDRGARGHHPPGGGLDGCPGCAGERRGRHALHEEPQVCGDALALLRGAQGVVQPLLPELQSCRQLLVRQARVLLPRQHLLAGQGLLKLLPVLLANLLVAHCLLVPLELQLVALVSEERPQSFVRHWKLGSVGQLLAGCQGLQHLGGHCAQLVPQLAAGGVLHSVPGSLDTELLGVVHGTHKLPHEGHKGRAAQWLPAHSFWVRMARRYKLSSHGLHARSEFTTQGLVWELVEVLKLGFLDRRLHQGGAVPVAEELQQALADLLRRPCSCLVQGASCQGQRCGMQSLLQVFIWRHLVARGVPELQDEVSEDPEQGGSVGLLPPLLHVLGEAAGERQRVKDALVQCPLGV